ncbi:restriction endonuclease subunit S [Cronobacter muytjensii]|nr:restriction endonuclease subunit S [Cronobacter muytjensii]
MAKYKAYPEYKDSGVEWLGEIPEHWKLSKLRYQFFFNKGLTITKEHLQEEGIPCVNYGEVHSKYGFEVDPEIHTLKCVSDKYLKETSNALLAKGDIVFADTSEDIDGSGNFTQLVSDTVTFAGYHTIIARPFERDCCRFYAYLLDCKELRSQVRHAVKGVKVFSITQSILRNLSIWLPSKDEQAQIAVFLDHETAKIDNLIEKQQQLIELLKEKRQAVISHAVTKGLNPDVPMKDSGVEWLGEVPKHWLCTKIKYVSALTPKKLNINLGMNDECTFIPMEKLKRNSLITDEIKSIREVINGYTYFEDNDLLVAKVTPCFENKNIAVASGLMNGIGFGSTEIYVLRPDNNIGVNYLLYRLQEDNFMRAATGAMTGAGGLKRVPSDFLLNYPIAIPLKPEMDAIAIYLNEQEARYELMENNVIRAVQLMQERRIALISAAVTGKIDVRDWRAPDAQKTEEPQEVTI